MPCVTASQARFFELFGEPGHTEPEAARLRRGRKLEVLLSEWALLSTLTAGLPTLRRIGNPSSQPLFLLNGDRPMGKNHLRTRQPCQVAAVAVLPPGSVGRLQKC